MRFLAATNLNRSMFDASCSPKRGGWARAGDVPIPEPDLGEVVVRIKSCGFCATDYKAIKGIRRNVAFPLVPGHEPSGIVAAVGPGVRHMIKGDAVICQPSGFCGACAHCKAAQYAPL